MAQEIERKFLVTAEFKSQARKQFSIIQGYLSSERDRTIRIRIQDDKAYLTIKGPTNTSGTTRYEWEKEIPLNEGEELLKFCEKAVIRKTRFLIDVGKHTFEVDEFYGDNEGLIIAEVELQAEDEPFKKPEWLGKEVTGELKYYNSMLIRNPFKDW